MADDIQSLMALFSPQSNSGLMEQIIAHLSGISRGDGPRDSYDPRNRYRWADPQDDGINMNVHPWPYVGQNVGSLPDPGIYGGAAPQSGDQLLYQPQPAPPPPMQGQQNSWMSGPSGPYPATIGRTPDLREKNGYWTRKYMGWDRT